MGSQKRFFSARERKEWGQESLFRAALKPAGDGVRDRPDEVDESDEERGGDRQHRDQRQRAACDAFGEHTAHTAFRRGQLRPIHRGLR